jgi:hypothetical protein
MRLPPTQRLLFLQAACAGLALVVLVTATGLLVWLRGGGTQPEAVLPAGAAAFARIDLDPSAEQKLAIFEIRKRFPRASADFSLKDDIVGVLLSAGGLDYERDVQPWLGDRVGVSVMPDGQVLIALQYSDRSAARAGLTRRAAQLGSGPATELPAFAFVPGEHYVVLAATQQGADGAARSSRHLDDDSAYAGATRFLADDQLVVAWADLGRLGPVLPEDVRADVSDWLGGLRGAVALGVRAQDALLDVRGSLEGLPAPAQAVLAGPPGTGLAANLPVGADVAVSGTRLGEAVAQVVERGLGRAEVLGLAIALRGQGVSYPDDLVALLGTEAGFAVRGQDLLLRSTSSSSAPDLGTRVQAALVALAPALAGFAEVLRPDGLGWIGGTGGGVAAAGGRPLRESSDFRRAVPDAVGARLVAYADVDALLALLGQVTELDLATVRQVAAPVRAVGLSVAPGDGSDVRVRLRLTVGD